MNKALIIGLLALALLLSGCTSAPTTPTPQPTETPVMTTTQPTETPVPTATITATTTSTPTTTATSTTQATPAGVAVAISNFTFNPLTITINNGTTVTWTNNDNVAHTVTSVTGVFDSSSISPGSTWSYTFNQTGTFEYGCTIHPSIPHGTVTVT